MGLGQYGRLRALLESCATIFAVYCLLEALNGRYKASVPSGKWHRVFNGCFGANCALGLFNWPCNAIVAQRATVG